MPVSVYKITSTAAAALCLGLLCTQPCFAQPEDEAAASAEARLEGPQEEAAADNEPATKDDDQAAEQ